MNEQQHKVSLPVLSFLGIAFVVLKLVGVIDWSWWLVLLPFSVPIVIALLLVAVIVIAGAIKALLLER